MKHRPTLSLLLATALLVVGFDYATFAATGDSLVLGRANTAAKTTTLKNAKPGPALSLTTKPGSPPLKVSSSTKVARLNADRVDGKDAADLGVRTLVYSTAPVFLAGTAEMDVETGIVPAGSYLVTINGVFGHGPGGLTGNLFAEAGVELAQMVAPANAAAVYDVGLTAVITLTEPRTLRYELDAPAPATYTSVGKPLQISLTRIDALSNRSAVASVPDS